MATHAIVLRILAVLASGLSSLQDSPSRQPYACAARLAGSDVLLFIVCRSGPEGGANECVGHGKFGACSPFAFFSGWPVALNEVGQVRFKQKSQSPRNYAHITQMSVMTNHKDRTVGMAREKSDLIYEAFNHFALALALLVQAGRPEDDVIHGGLPAAFDRKGAAKYLSIGTTKFGELVGEQLPKGVIIGGRPHWFREDLEKYLRKLKRENNN